MKYYDTWKPKSSIEEEARKEWLEERKKYLTASDFAAAVGDSPWKSQLELWQEKTGKKQPADLSVNAAVQYGIKMEPIIRDKFKADHPYFHVEYHQFDIYISTIEPWSACTLDGEIKVVSAENPYNLAVNDEGIFEAKTGSYRSAEDLAKWDQCPLYYTEQVMAQMFDRGASFGFLSAKLRYTGDEEYRGDLPQSVNREYFFRYDQKAEKELITRAKRFWFNFVKANVPPVTKLHSPEDMKQVAIFADTKEGTFLENFDAVEEEIRAIVEPYIDVVFTENQAKDAEALHAELNKMEKTIDEKRKAVKQKYEEPLKKFEEKANALKEIIAQVRKPIKAQCDLFEQNRMKAKEQEIASKALKAEVREITDEAARTFFIDQLGGVDIDKKWLNKTAKDKDIEAGISIQIASFLSDWKTIHSITENDLEMRTLLLQKYSESKDIRTVMLEKDRIETARKQAAEIKAKQEAARAAAEAEKPAHKIVIDTRKPMIEIPIQPKTEENTNTSKTLKAVFEAEFSSVAQAKALIDYMRSNNIKFKKIG